jgi:hypothetical protein
MLFSKQSRAHTKEIPSKEPKTSVMSLFEAHVSDNMDYTSGEEAA